VRPSVRLEKFTTLYIFRTAHVRGVFFSVQKQRGVFFSVQKQRRRFHVDMSTLY
jgi:hypothetical protein